MDGTEGATQNRPEDTFDGGVNMDSKIRDEPSPKEEVFFSFDAREKIFEMADDFGSRVAPDRPAGGARETPAPMTSQSRLAGNRQPAEGKLPANGDGGYYDLPPPWSGGYQSAYPHYQPQGSYPYARGYEGSNRSRREPGTPTQDMSIADRMSNMENMMGKMAGVYQATMERFAHLANCPTSRPEAQATMAPAPPTAAKPAVVPESGAKDGVEKPEKQDLLGATAYTDSDSEEGDSAWKDYHGVEMWRAAKDKIKKNPFVHAAFLKRGEEVNSFERLMLVHFKTMQLLLEMKHDVSGLVKHGIAMSEKAAKKVYEPEAFIVYDESVRERAGLVGPSAYGNVVQEDMLRFFSCEYMRRTRSIGKEKSQASKKKSDKLCIRFNDNGCNAKSCAFVHKCVHCDSDAHGKKDCRSEKKNPAK